MVREARFSWDETDGFEPPVERDGFDDEDADDLLDPLPPKKERSPNRRNNGRKDKEGGPQPDRESRRRHLAGADWLNDGGDDQRE